MFKFLYFYVLISFIHRKSIDIAATPVSLFSAKLAFHIFWNQSQVKELESYVHTIYQPNNVYLIDLIAPNQFRLSSQTFELPSLKNRSNVRLRKIDYVSQYGVSETLALLDGMAELIWWEKETKNISLDFYIPLLRGSRECFLLSVPSMHRVLGATLSQFPERPPSFFKLLHEEEKGARFPDLESIYFDSSLYFSKNNATRKNLLGPYHLSHETETKLLPTVRTEKEFILGFQLVRYLVDSVSATRYLASLIHYSQVTETFFGSVALSIGKNYSQIVHSTSCRCTMSSARNSSEKNPSTNAISGNGPCFFGIKPKTESCESIDPTVSSPSTESEDRPSAEVFATHAILSHLTNSLESSNPR